MLSKGLGRVNYFTEPEAKALLDLKGKWGFTDPRNEMKNCDVCANDIFRESWKAAGVTQTAFTPPSFKGNNASGNGNASGNANQEALIQAITERVMAELSKRT
jgi:L-fuculose-phosphate aldolase